MCLENPSTINTTTTVGYVVLLIPKNEKYQSVYSCCEYQLGVRETAINATTVLELGRDGKPRFRKSGLAHLTYNPGFHGFFTLDDAREFLKSNLIGSELNSTYCICKAKFEDLFIQGTYHNLPCFAAKHRTLLEEIETPQVRNSDYPKFSGK